MGAVIDNQTVIIDNLPADTVVNVVGVSNTLTWGQKILVVTPVAGPYVWERTGHQLNTVLGTVSLAKTQKASSMKVELSFQPTGGQWTPAKVSVTPFTAPGLAGYVVGGSDTGPRPSGPRFDNTAAFVYWAVGY